MKKTKPKIFIVEDKVYNRHILICVGASHKEIVEYIQKRKHYPLDREENETLKCLPVNLGRTVQLKNGSIVMMFREYEHKPIWYAVLSHEVSHAVNMVFDICGVEYTKDSDEVAAYYNQFIVKSILEELL